MFYSPTKQFVRFSTYRTAEIKALKQRIQKEKVTPEEITATQMRLEKLKAQYELLQQENHGELKEVLQSSETAIAQLIAEKTAQEKELLEMSRQVADLQAIKQELQEKGCLVEQQLRGEVQEREQLADVKAKYQENILLLDKQYDSLVREISKQRDIQNDVRTAEADLARKWEAHRAQAEDCRKERQELMWRIAEERAEQARQQKEWELCEKQLERQEVLKEKGRVTDQLLRVKIEALTAGRMRQTETAWMLGEEQVTADGLADLTSSILEETVKIEKSQLSCQREIKEILIRLSQEEALKCKLEQRVSTIRGNLRLLKDKNENLRNKMNSIFRNDCELIKTISNKKVFPNCKQEVVDIVKKTAVQPIIAPSATKENILLPIGKPEKVESVLSPRVFVEANRLI